MYLFADALLLLALRLGAGTLQISPLSSSVQVLHCTALHCTALYCTVQVSVLLASLLGTGLTCHHCGPRALLRLAASVLTASCLLLVSNLSPPAALLPLL